MVQLKQVSLRLKSIKNIQKITKTMKMVSASKFTKAERELQAARPFGYGPRKFYQSSRLASGPVGPTAKGAAPAPDPPAIAPAPPAPDEDKEEQKKLRRIFIAMTSDRGLCGGVHSGVARRVRREVAARGGTGPEASAATRLVCVGDKARAMLWRAHANMMLMSVKDLGRIAPVFADASLLAAAVASAGFPYDVGEIFYNHYHTPVKYELSSVPFFTKLRIERAPNMSAFDEADEDLESYAEWTLAALLFYALKQGAAAEQSARMAAMDNATENAAAMIRALTLLYNRTRQAVITRELIEIISGAAALK